MTEVRDYLLGNPLVLQPIPRPSDRMVCSWQVNLTLYGASGSARWTSAITDPVSQVRIHLAKMEAAPWNESKPWFTAQLANTVHALEYMTGLGKGI